MTENVPLRDYFAARAELPEPADICEIMGWEKDLKLGDGDEVGSEEWKDTVYSRWHELPMATRITVVTAYRYRVADEMLKQRVPPASKPKKPVGE